MAQRALDAHDLFLSYAREDLDFVRQLRDHLNADGLQVWVDIDGIYGGEEFWPEICRAIDAAAAVVFVISPHSAGSPYCRREVERAVAAGKRLVPICCGDVDPALLPGEAAARQWILCPTRDDLGRAAPALIRAVRTDWSWIRTSARLLVRAREWDAAGRDTSLTLGVRELRAADEWTKSVPADEAPTPLHLEFIRASHEARRQRIRRLSALAAAALAAIAGVMWLAFARQIESLNEQARVNLDQGHVETALGLLDRAETICARLPLTADRCANAASTAATALVGVGRYGESLSRFSALVDAAAEWPASDNEAQARRANAYRGRAYARIMHAESLADAAHRNREYALALDDVAMAAEIEERAQGTAKLHMSAVTKARVHLGQGAYESALNELNVADRFAVKDPQSIALLRALAYRCIGNLDLSQKWLGEYVTGQSLEGDTSQFALAMAYFKGVADRCRDQPH
jgi:tetratricopeptide (TPR) repeat protein